VRLSSIINIRDFEIAASKLLPPRSFACKRLSPSLSQLPLTIHSLQNWRKRRIHSTMEPFILARNPFPSPHPPPRQLHLPLHGGPRHKFLSTLLHLPRRRREASSPGRRSIDDESCGET
jgi:hypothetical protein